MIPLRLGKLPPGVLEDIVLSKTGATSPEVSTPAKVGLDFAAVRVGSGFMLVSADPITGVSDNIGEYAIRVSANDVATSGNRPQYAETVVLLPEGSGKEEVRDIASQMDEAARSLGIAIVGGHTEVTPGLARPIVVVTSFSFSTKYVSSGDAKAGDSIMMTKTAGLEGTAVLAGQKGLLAGRVPGGILRKARGFLSKISVVDEAVAAYETGFVRAMHDCTEGGVLGAVFEMSRASGLGFRIMEESVPIEPATVVICENLGLDPLKLIASGSLLLSVEPGMETRVRKALKPICSAAKIGEFTKQGMIVVGRRGKARRVRSAPEDELWRALGMKR